MTAVKPLANSVTLDDTPTQVSDSRFQLITNVDSTHCFVQLGANSSVIYATVPVESGQSLVIDIGAMNVEYTTNGTAEKWMWLETAPSANTVFRTPVGRL